MTFARYCLYVKSFVHGHCTYSSLYTFSLVKICRQPSRYPKRINHTFTLPTLPPCSTRDAPTPTGLTHETIHYPLASSQACAILRRAFLQNIMVAGKFSLGVETRVANASLAELSTSTIQEDCDNDQQIGTPACNIITRT